MTLLLLLLQDEGNVASIQTEIGDWPLHGERMHLFIACKSAPTQKHMHPGG